mmetsp:Transcript_31323/g.61002  ORF Transcript_31323/g.61002 Transcript_31323/m.61002 type:complete len:295 (+) Transcript_31323:175-1059(+)
MPNPPATALPWAGTTPSVQPALTTKNQALDLLQAHAHPGSSRPKPTLPNARHWNGRPPILRHTLTAKLRLCDLQTPPSALPTQEDLRLSWTPNKHSHASGSRQKTCRHAFETIVKLAKPLSVQTPPSTPAEPSPAPCQYPKRPTAPEATAQAKTQPDKALQSPGLCATASAATTRRSQYRSMPFAEAARRSTKRPAPCCHAQCRTTPALRRRCASLALPFGLSRASHTDHRPRPWETGQSHSQKSRPAPRLLCGKARGSVADESDHSPECKTPDACAPAYDGTLTWPASPLRGV